MMLCDIISLNRIGKIKMHIVKHKARQQYKYTFFLIAGPTN